MIFAWRTFLLTAAVLLVASLVTRAGTYHNKPDPAATGGVSGVVAPAKGLQAVIVIEPFELKAYEAEIDAASGRFQLKGLPVGEYDLLIKTVGHVYEGITLEWDADLHPSAAELTAMCDGVGKTFVTTEDYFNVKRIVRLTGAEQRVRMFTMQTRTKDVVTPAGEPIRAHIRRFDLIEMVKTRDVWQLMTGRHLLRQEVPLDSPDLRIQFTHSPALGGILVGAKVNDLGTIHLAQLPPGPSSRYGSAAYGTE